MGASKISAIIALDGEKEFKQAVTSVNKELSNLKSQGNLVKETYAGQANGLEALKAKHEVLNKTLAAHNKKYVEVNKGLDNAKEQYKKVGDGLEELKKQEEEAKKKMEEMKKSSDATTEELEEQEKALKELSDAIKKGEENYNNAGNRVQEWQGKLATAETQTVKCSRELDKNAGYMKEAEGATDKCAKSINEFGKETKKTGESAQEMGDKTKAGINAMAEVLVAAGIAKGVKEIAKELYECSKAAETFESSTAKLSTIADETKVSMGKMSADVLALSSDAGKAATSIAESTYQAISASVDTEKAVTSVEKANKLAVAGFTEVETAIDVLTTSVNAYGLEAEKMDNISDMMLLTQNLGKTSVGELGSTMGKVIPIAAAYNVQLDNLCTGYTILTANGVKTAESTTSLKAMINELGKSSSKVSQILEEETGKAFGQLSEEGMSLGDVLQILSDRCDGDATAFANLWSSQQASVGALTLFNKGAEAFNETLEKMRNSAGTTEEAYKKMTDTTEFAKEKMQNSTQNLKIAIGQQLNPALKELYKTGGNAFDWATKFVNNNPAVVSAITGLITALEILLAGLAAFTILKKITPMIKAFTAALSANPYILVATAIAGVVAALATYTASTKKATTEAEKLAEASNDVRESTKELRANINESSDAWEKSSSEMEAQGIHAQNLSEKLFDLADKEEKSVHDKLRMSEAVAQLNTIMPELGLAIDEETGALNMNEEQLNSLINTNIAYAKAKGAQERLTEITKEMVDVEVKKIEAETRLQDTEKELASIQNERNKLTQKAKDGTVEYEGVLMNVADAQERLSAASNDYELGIANEKNKKSVKELNDEFEKLETKSEAVKKYAEDQTAISGVTEKLNEATAATGEFTDAEALAATNESAKQIAEKYEEMKESIEQSIKSVISIFDEFNGGQEITTEEILKNLHSQVEGTTKWKENMEYLADQAGDGVSQQFLSHLTDMGVQGANAIKALADNTRNGGTAFADAAKEYAAGLDISAEIADISTKNKLAVEYGAEDVKNAISNSGIVEEAEKTGDKTGNVIGEGMKGQAGSAAVAMGEFRKVTEAELQTMVDAAKKYGVEGAAELGNSLASGSVTVSDGAAQLYEAIRAQFAQMQETATAAGIQIPTNLQQQIAAGGPGAVSALEQVAALLKGNYETMLADSNAYGQGSGQNYADGFRSRIGDITKTTGDAGVKGAKEMEGTKGHYTTTGSGLIGMAAVGATSASGTLSNAAALAANGALNAANNYVGSFNGVGYNMILGVARGIDMGRAAAAGAAAAAAAAALQAAKNAAGVRSPARVWKAELGLMMAKGMALGIVDGKKDTITAGAELSKAALKGAQEEAEIHSPSKKFKNAVGKQIARGYAFGIKENTGTVKKSAAQLSKEVYSSATSWLANYKKTHKVSLEDEQYYWEQIKKKTKYGTTEYYKVLNKLDLTKFKKNTQKAISAAFNVSWLKGKDSKGNNIYKTATEYYNDILSAADNYLYRYKITHKTTLDYEEYYWTQVRKKLKKGTQAWYEATANIKAAQASIKQELLSASDTALDQYKVYYQVSEAAEVEYWNIVRKQFKTGTTERIEADKKYYEAKAAYNDKLKSLNEDYVANCKEVNETLKEQVADLNQKYNDAVADRAKSIYDSYGLFDKFSSESENGTVLLYNLKTQVAGYADWELQLEQLKERGISEGLLEELQEMGPSASAALHALNEMTEEDLTLYDELWQQKMALATSQATKELEGMREETTAEIKALGLAASTELARLKLEYNAAVTAAKKAIEAPLKTLASNAKKTGEDVTAKLVAGIKSGATANNTKVTLQKANNEITTILKQLPKASGAIGTNTLEGILKGLTNKTSINASAKTLVNELEKAIKAAAGIKSPSRLFEKEIGIQLSAGVGVGIEKGTGTATESATTMISDVIGSAKERMKTQMTTLSTYMESLNSQAGLTALDDLLQMPTAATAQSQSYKQNSDALAQMVELLGGCLEALQLPVRAYLDKGEAIKELAPGIEQKIVNRRTR